MSQFTIQHTCPTPAAGRSPTKTSALWTAIAAALVGLMGPLLIISSGMAASHPADVVLEPVPSTDKKVSRVLQLAGTAKIRNDTDYRSLFVVVASSNGTRWPQGYASVKDGQWKCLISLGSSDPKDDGTYTVLIVMADPSAAAAMAKFVKYDLAKSKTGMKNYPDSSHVRIATAVELERSLSVKTKLKRAHPDRGCQR